MSKCEEWTDDGDIFNAALKCNMPGCSHKFGPSQPMLCDCCEAKMPKPKIRYAEAEPGPAVFACGHEEKYGDFGFGAIFGCCVDHRMKCPDCLGWKRPPKLKPRPLRKDAFTKFTMPVIRPQPPEQGLRSGRSDRLD
jgi:hypothetical protein